MIEPIIAKKYPFGWIARRFGVLSFGVSAEQAIEGCRVQFGWESPASARRTRKIPALIYTRIHGIHE